MADVRITGADCLDLWDEIDSIKTLAGALWMATHALNMTERSKLAALSSLIEGRLQHVSTRFREGVNAGSSHQPSPSTGRRS